MAEAAAAALVAVGGGVGEQAVHLALRGMAVMEEMMARRTVAAIEATPTTGC